MNKKENLPLSGIIVLDLTSVLSGPFATSILRDLGAKIIKIEKPDGDDSRKFGPFINNKSCYFISLNRGKKSIVLNLKNNEDKSIFSGLLEKADVLIDNYKPGVLEKFGFSWKYLNRNYPKLIHSKNNERIRFQWINGEEDEADCYFEFKIEVDEITKDVSLIVSDFSEEDELEESKLLWENLISDLKQVLGSA